VALVISVTLVVSLFLVITLCMRYPRFARPVSTGR
jgi:hypothetical protein